jgi:hypothetical protein
MSQLFPWLRLERLCEHARSGKAFTQEVRFNGCSQIEGRRSSLIAKGHAERVLCRLWSLNSFQWPYSSGEANHTCRLPFADLKSKNNLVPGVMCSITAVRSLSDHLACPGVSRGVFCPSHFRFLPRPILGIILRTPSSDY